MKIAHWSMKNGSGMHHVAESMARAELSAGVDSRCLDPFDPAEADWEWALDADAHVGHTRIPDLIAKKPFKASCTKPWRVVFPVHGTPELVFESTVTDGAANGYGAGRSYAGHQIGMQEADAIVTFWPRHRDLYDLATDKHTIVDLVPMGINAAYWQGGASKGKYEGAPSFFNCDNAYAFKWAIEVLRVWRLVLKDIPHAGLHISHIPTDLLRHVDALAMRYGSLTRAWVGSWSYDHDNLRNIYKSVDFYISPVRYGDFNRTSLEAGAGGAKVISYPGNEYADFWMPEGDQRAVAAMLVQIGKGDVEPRPKTPIPSEEDMAQAMIHVYERILDRAPTNFALGEIPDAIDRTLRDAQLSATGPGLDEAPPTAPRPKAPTGAEIQAMVAKGTA